MKDTLDRWEKEAEISIDTINFGAMPQPCISVDSISAEVAGLHNRILTLTQTTRIALDLVEKVKKSYEVSSFTKEKFQEYITFPLPEEDNLLVSIDKSVKRIEALLKDDL